MKVKISPAVRLELPRSLAFKGTKPAPRLKNPLEEIKSVRWRDASLGCPKPGVDYIQVETPGYNILLQTGGSTYSYHTDETRRFVACNK